MKGDHLAMTRSDLARPVIIKMCPDLGPDIVASNVRTLGLTSKQFDDLVDQVRGHKKEQRKKRKSKTPPEQSL